MTHLLVPCFKLSCSFGEVGCPARGLKSAGVVRWLNRFGQAGHRRFLGGVWCWCCRGLLRVQRWVWRRQWAFGHLQLLLLFGWCTAPLPLLVGFVVHHWLDECSSVVLQTCVSLVIWPLVTVVATVSTSTSLVDLSLGSASVFMRLAFVEVVGWQLLV
jgi:hypothetical protein